MKKTFKWIAIITSFLVAFLVVASIALYLFLPLDKIKDFAALKLSETLQRDVLIEKVSFNIFTGIKLEKVSIGDSKKFAPRPFISADAVALHYDLWPLLSRKVVINEISLIKPEILVEKSANGAFNFSDLLNPAKLDAKETALPAENPLTSPIDLSIKSFSISSGKITYIDQAAGSRSSINDLNLKVSGFELSMAKPIELSLSANIGYQGKTIPLSLNGRILANLPKNELSISSLSLSVAGESAYLTGNVSSFSSGPSIN